jgi:uracil-DNA glycosylase
MSLYENMSFLEEGWREVLREEFEQPYMQELIQFVQQERNSGVSVYPPEGDVFSAFQQTPFDSVKVVIVGQDPYHGPGQAHGLCFSVKKGITPPPSLKNIYKELVADVGIECPEHGELTSWTKQGILLINTTLTVRQGQPKSHYGKGWERFTDTVIERLCEKKEGVIFVLWGRSAQKKCNRVIDTSKHHVLQAAHPSPLSIRGFSGCRHFSQINNILALQRKERINWSVF